jgi:hypothetical protein
MRLSTNLSELPALQPPGATAGRAVGSAAGDVAALRDPNSYLSILKGGGQLFAEPYADRSQGLNVDYPSLNEWNFDPRQDLNRVQQAVGEVVAVQAKKRQRGELAVKMAFQGHTFEEQAEMAKQDAAAVEEAAQTDAAAAIAGETQDLDDEQFEQLLGRLKAELGTNPAAPQMGTPDMPNHTQLAIAALGSIALPHQAFEIGATPFNEQLRREAVEFQNKQLQYKADLEARAGRIAAIQAELGVLGQERELAARSRENELDRKSREGMNAADNATQLTGIELRNEQGQINKLYDSYYKGGSPEIREGARRELYNLTGYDPGPAAPLTPAEQQKLASAGLSTAKTKTEDGLREARKQQVEQRTNLYKSQIKLTDNRAKMVAEVTKGLGDESAAKVAVAWATVDNLENLIATRGEQLVLDTLRNDRESLDATVESIRDGLKEWSGAADNARRDIDKLKGDKRNLQLVMAADEDLAKSLAPQVQAIDAEIAEKEREITNAKAQYDALQSKAAALQKKVEGTKSTTRPKAEAGASRLTQLGEDLKGAHGGRFEQFNNRDVRGKPGKPSKHTGGLAIDYYNTTAKMNAIVNELIRTKRAKYMIYQGRDWKPGRGWRKYDGIHPHNDHIHIQ